MLGMDQYEMIRTAHRKYGKGIRELAREFGHHRKTIRKILAGEEPRYRREREVVNPVMDSVGGMLQKWLKEDLEAPKKQRHTARRIYTRLAEEYGFGGAESTVRRWVRQCKVELGYRRGEAVIPLSPEVAREAEVDWGQAWVEMNGEKREVKLFCMRSRYSGKIFVRAYAWERQEMFFDGHMAAFGYFGGVFPVLVYDNLTVAVQAVLRGKRRREQERFVSFRSYYTFEARYCNPGKGNEKGGVEGGVGYARRNFLVPLPQVESFEELNRLLLERCVEHSGKRLDSREDRRRIEERHEEERGRLLPLPENPFENLKLVPVRISRYQTAQVDRNRYSVPTAYVGRRLWAHVGCWTVSLYDGTRKIVEHLRVFGNSKWQIDPLHYLGLIGERVGAFDSARAICQWRPSWPGCYEEMLRKLVVRQGDNRGKREFVRILQLHQDCPAGAVEEAVGETVACGAYSYDAVKHVLRMKEGRFAEASPLPEDLIPGITDRRIEISDVRRYGALLEGGAA
ncbi:MAG: IS21 family transposase [Deltaproteobacteria bacterium]|nr:MAG: IS21 family transposase [Deltaproteobacteria bacterium]RPJ42100.1 MAG: IS21 family transposase [Deltaproteobacteria bacterium]